MASESPTLNECFNEAKSLISLLKSNNIDLQYNALKGLMFCPIVCAVNVFLEEDNLHYLIVLSSSSHKRVEAASLRLLWHLSAQAELKVRLYEENVTEKLKKLMDSDDPEMQFTCSAILQNITEYRFEKGDINPNQVKIVNEGILDHLQTRIMSADKRVQFLTCLTVCNLSMNEENTRKILRSQLLEGVRRFVEENKMQIDIVCHWITLQPHVPLVRSAFPQVQLFSLSCLLSLIRNDQYRVEVWKALSVNEAVGAIFSLCKSSDVLIAQLATQIISSLQLEEPVIKVEPSNVGLDLQKMFNNSEFSDIQIACKGGVVYAHKAILASRCQHFHVMFTKFRESQQHQITLQGFDYDVIHAVIQWIYTGKTNLTRKTVVEVMVVSEMYSLKELKQKCEYFLWHYVDVENATALYQTACLHQAFQLKRVCSDFIVRNFHNITTTESYLSLPQEIKDEIKHLLTGDKPHLSNFAENNNNNNKTCEEKDKVTNADHHHHHHQANDQMLPEQPMEVDLGVNYE